MKRFFQRILDQLLRSQRVRDYLGRRKRVGAPFVRQDPYEQIGVQELQVNDQVLRLFPFGELSQWRYETFFTKEPETLEWIDGFQKGVLWDIGANIGLYSLYAGMRGDIEVLSFEPSAVNYFILNRNIALNAMDRSVSSYCLAFAEESEVGYLELGNDDPAGALSNFAASGTLDHPGESTGSAEFSFRQGMVGFSIDGFIQMYSPAFPNYLKIDVDGIESQIIKGAQTTLKDPRLRSVLIELDENLKVQKETILKVLNESGFELSAKRQAPMFSGGEFASVFNHIFTRRS